MRKVHRRKKCSKIQLHFLPKKGPDVELDTICFLDRHLWAPISFPCMYSTQPNPTETAQLNLLTFNCAQINILLCTMWLNLKLCQNLTWVRLSHFSVVSPNQCAMQCTLCNVHGHSSVQWVEGGGKRLKQVYFIGAGSAMDLVHSAAWERWKGPTLIQYLFTLHCHPTHCTAQKLYLVCVHTATLICVHTLPPWYVFTVQWTLLTHYHPANTI